MFEQPSPTMPLPTFVRIIDVAPRDGLQNEKQPVPTHVKIELVHRLQDAGLREIEVTSFVSAKWVPQMADNAAVMHGILRNAAVRYSALIPNMQGLDASLASPREEWPDEIVVFGAASEAFSQKNINCSIAESIERFAPVVAAAREKGIAVRGSMSCALGCPYEGEIAPAKVEYLARLMKSIGVERVDIADTIGVGSPHTVKAAVEATGAHFHIDAISGHFHDTYGQALVNTLAALQLGVWNFQSSVAGLGGCPYAKGATGNVATEDLVYMVHRMGIQTGIDLDQLIGAGVYISQALGREPISRVSKAICSQRTPS